MAAFKLSMISPRGKAYEGDCDSLAAPGVSGDLGILAGHAPMIAMLRPGITKIVTGGTTAFYVTGEGICEVTWDAVNLLVDTAAKFATLDEARAALAAQAEPAKK